MQRGYFIIATMWAIALSCLCFANDCSIDISQKKQAETLLDEHSRTLKTMYDTLKDITDKDSAESSIPILSQLRKRAQTLENEILKKKYKKVTIQHHLEKNREFILGILREEERLEEKNFTIQKHFAHYLLSNLYIVSK